MEESQKAYKSAVSQAQESAAKISSYASSFDKAKPVMPSSSAPSSSSGMGSSSALTVDHSGNDGHPLLEVKPLVFIAVLTITGQFLSVWTASKLCAVCFVAGVFVGYTLKRRVKRWASRILRRLKDD